MGINNDNSGFWYQKTDGSWGSLNETSSISISISEESAAKLASILVPLGDLEIIPRGEE